MPDIFSPDDLLKNAIWLTELLVVELEGLHAQASSLEGVAKGTVSFTPHDAKQVLEQVEIIAFGVGAIQSAIGEFRAFIPEVRE
jgi:hypothetical protein